MRREPLRRIDSRRILAGRRSVCKSAVDMQGIASRSIFDGRKTLRLNNQQGTSENIHRIMPSDVTSCHVMHHVTSLHGIPYCWASSLKSPFPGPTYRSVVTALYVPQGRRVALACVCADAYRSQMCYCAVLCVMDWLMLEKHIFELFELDLLRSNLSSKCSKNRDEGFQPHHPPFRLKALDLGMSDHALDVNVLARHRCRTEL